MAEADDQQFEEANAAATRAASAFVDEIESLFGKWEAVAPSFVLEVALLELSADLSDLADDLKRVAGPATKKLLDAFAEYRDAPEEDR